MRNFYFLNVRTFAIVAILISTTRQEAQAIEFPQEINPQTKSVETSNRLWDKQTIGAGQVDKERKVQISVVITMAGGLSSNQWYQLRNQAFHVEHLPKVNPLEQATFTVTHLVGTFSCNCLSDFEARAHISGTRSGGRVDPDGEIFVNALCKQQTLESGAFPLPISGESTAQARSIKVELWTSTSCEPGPSPGPTDSPSPGPSDSPSPGPSGDPSSGPSFNPDPGSTGSPSPGPSGGFFDDDADTTPPGGFFETPGPAPSASQTAAPYPNPSNTASSPGPTYSPNPYNSYSY